MKKFLIIACMVLILLFITGVSFAASDVDQLQADYNITEKSDSISASVVDENNGGIGEDVLSVSPDNDVLKGSDELYISPTGAGDQSGLDSDNPTVWSNAFSNINSGGTIYFLNGTYNNIKGQSLSKSVTLKGIGNVVLDGNGNNGNAFFKISSMNNIVIDNLKFINGKASSGAAITVSDNSNNIIFKNLYFENNNYGYDGGAIDIESNSYHIYNYTFQNCTFKDNHANYGGAFCIQKYVMNINVIDCIFINNNANKPGASIWIGDESEISFKNCKFINSTCTSDDISTLYVESSAKVKYINDTEFINCSSTSNGAAVYFNSEVNDLSVINSTFINCNSYNGGAFYFKSVTDLNILNCSFKNCNAKNFGGALFFNSKAINCKFDNVKVINNTAGTAIIYFNGEINNVTFNKSYFINNTQNKDGSIYIFSSGDLLTIAESEFINNKGSAGSGVCIEKCKNVYVFNSNFTGNSATSVDYGGALYMGDGDLITINNVKFSNNSIASYGGAIHLYNIGVNINNSIFENNNAKYGLAIYASSELSKMFIINNTNFTNHKSANPTSTIYFNKKISNFYCENSNFINNTALTDGGVIKFNTVENSYIKNSNFTLNTATGKGGAIYITTANNMDIVKCNFSNNSASEGGAIYVNAGSALNIFDSGFSNNHADNGGAVYLNSNNGKLTNLKFNSNTAVKNGGAVYILGDNNQIINSTFNQNNAENGGAIYIDASSASSNKIHNSTFTGNKGINGGAVYINNNNKNSDINTIINSTFIKNIADYNGGGLYTLLKDGSAFVDWNDFSGHALRDSQTSRLTWCENINYNYYHLINCSFIDNEDYLIKVEATSDGINGVITVTVPSNVKKSKVVNNGEEMTVYLITEEGFETKYTIDVIENGVGKLTIPNLAGGNYNVSVHFKNNNYLLKYNSTSFIHTVIVKGDFETIQDLINEAILNNQSEVNLTRNYVFSVGLDVGEIVINSTKALTIRGIGMITIDALGKCRIFNVNSSDVTFENINFINGNTYGENGTIERNGGAILLKYPNAKIINCEFYNNTAYDGGAIFIENTANNVLINNSRFSNNIARANGGAVDWNATDGHLENSQLYNNKAKYGGAVFVGVNTTSGVIKQSTFINNTASENGGAVDWNATGGNVEKLVFTNNTAKNGGAIFVGVKSTLSYIKSSTFDNNNADGRGGAVDWYASNGEIEDSTFTGNHADYGGAVFVGKASDGGKIINSKFISNTADVKGGAVDWNASSGYIEFSQFNMNSAKYGGAVFVGANGYAGKILNSNFTDNTASERGGAVDWYASSGDVEYSLFINNKANYGGAIFVGHETSGGKVSHSIFTSNTATIKGGAIDWNASSGNVTYCSFDKNHADYGGAIFVGTKTDSGKILNSNFTANSATYNGGAVDWNATGGEIMNSNFNSNTANYGGAVFVGASAENGYIHNSNFTSNNALRGGAIDWNASNGIINESNFKLNTADYGGAMFVGHGAVKALILSSSFVSNEAENNGGAILFDNVDNVTLFRSDFTLNKANHGGAIYGDNYYHLIINASQFTSNDAEYCGAVHWDGRNGTVVNTTFTRNNAKMEGGALGWKGMDSEIYNVTFIENTAGKKGGAILWYGDNTDIIHNAIFNKNTAYEGGGIYWMDANGGLIRDSTFNDNVGFENGGAIMIFNNTGGIIANISFNNNQAPGHYDVNRIEYGNGGAIAIKNTDSVTLTNLTLNNNYANLKGGAIYGFNANKTELYNLTFNNNEAKQGGSVAWINSSNLNITLNTFKNSVSHDEGGSIFINGTYGLIKDVEFDATNAKYAQAGAVYLNGNITINNATFTNYKSLNNQATAILFDGGNSTLVNSTLSGENPIIIREGATVYLTENNITDSINGDYSVLNEGDLYLSSNKFDNVIINDGIIETQTYTVILNNETITVQAGSNALMNATIVDDNNNTIVSKSFKFKDLTNNKLINSTISEKYNFGTYEEIEQGKYIISAQDSGLKNNTVKTGTIIVKVTTTLDINITQPTEGQVIIKVTLNPKGDYDFTGNVSFEINGKITPIAIENSNVAILTLNNYTADTYKVTATFDGDEYHGAASNESIFVIKLREAKINITVNDVLFGQNTTVVATTNANGTVTFVFKGKKYIVNIENGEAKLQLNSTDLNEARQYSISVSNNQNEYYSSAMNSTSFNVFKLNTTISADATELIKVHQNEIINVTVNENATGVIKIIINGKEYIESLSEGKAQFNISGLVKGEYNNITVNYTGDDYFNGNSTNISFKVIPTDEYNITVKADNIKYGENATVFINLPSDASGNVTVYIDNLAPFTNVVVKNGVAILENVSGLDAGNHTVNVTYYGDESYAPKDKNGTIFIVEPAKDWELNINVEEHEYGQNTIINITAPEDALNNNITVNIDGKNYTVDLTDGKGSLVLNNLSAGVHEVSAKYIDDGRYSNKTASTKFFIEKITPTIIISVDPIKVGQNATININIPQNVTGNITIYVGDKEFNRTVVNHNVQLNVSDLAYGKQNVVVYYNGDENYTKSSNSTNLTVDKWASQVNITIKNHTCMVGDSFTIKITNNTFANVTINGKTYNILSNGNINITSSELAAGEYRVSAITPENDKYFANSTTVIFNIIKYNSTVNVTVLPDEVHYVGDVFVINVTNNTVAKVTINGKEYNVLANGNVNVSTGDLAAGEYTVVVTTPENQKYNANMSNVSFIINKRVSSVNVTVNATHMFGDSFDIIVENSTVVNVTINGKAYSVLADKKVNITTSNLSAGHYVVIATIYENGKYLGNSTTKEFDIIKYNSSVSVVVLPDEVHYVGDSFVINVTNNTVAKVTINGKEYNVLANGNVNVSTGDLAAGEYTVIVTTPENDKYNANMSNVSFTIVKRASSVNVTVNATHMFGEVFDIIVENSTVVNVTINGKAYSVLADKKVNITTSNLPAGHYVVIATIYENGKYLGNSTTKEFDIIKYNSSVSVVVLPDEVHYVGDVFVINVTNNTVAKVTINGKEYNILANGNVNVSTADLAAGEYTVVVTTPENQKYNSNMSNVSFIINKRVSSVNVTVNATHMFGDSFDIIVENSTVVNVTINGKAYSVLADKKVNITTSNLSAGHYVVIATIYENGKYLGNSATKEFDILKYNSTVNVTVLPDTIHYVGDVFVINVTNNTVAKVTINGKEYNILANGTVNVTTSDLATGEYTVIATTPENDKYYTNSSTIVFTISKRISNVTVIVGNEFIYGSIFNVTIKNTTAVNVTLNGKKVNVKADGTLDIDSATLTAGHYVVIATIYENAKYLPSTDTKEFDVIKLNSNVTVTIDPNKTHIVGDTFTIKVTNTTVAKVTINGEEYAILSDGTVNVTTSKLAAGEYTVTATTPENNKYYGNSSTVKFTIIKIPSSVNVTVNATHMFGDVFDIIVENDTIVNVTINGKPYSIRSNGTVNITTSTLPTGHYVVIATIYENAKYLGNSATKEFDIIKLNSTVNVTVLPDTIHYVGDSFIINVTNNTVAKVTINGKEYNVLANGNVNVSTADLAAGEYTVIATTPENDKYYTNSSTMVFTISKRTSSVNVTVGDQFVYGTVFNITVENTTVVNVTLNGKKVDVKADGTLDIDSTTLAAGHYVVIATIYENAKYLGGSDTKEFNITKLNSTVSISINPNGTHIVGDKFTIKVENNTVAKVTINGEEYAILSDGTVNITTSKLAAGEYTVIATTPENAKYYANSTTVKFTINKIPSQVNVTVNPNTTHYVGDSFTIKVENSTAATVTVNGVDYKLNSDGTVNITTSKLAAGEYTVTAVIAENEKYLANSSSVSFTITKLNSTVKVHADNINYGQDAMIVVDVPKAQTGYVTVTVNGKNQTALIKNGQAIINITGLNVKIYSIKAVYLGDDNYFANTNQSIFEVFKADLNATVIGQNVTNKDNSAFVIDVPDNFNGIVNITVDNITSSGEAKSLIQMDKLTTGNKTAKVVFYGDPNYNDLELNVTFKVSNVTEAANITTIKSENMTRGYNSQYDYQAAFLDSDGNALADTKVQFVVNNKSYTVKTNKDGIAQLTNAKLGVGKYNITSINLATGESTVNEVNIVKRIIKNKDMTIDFLSGKYYVVQVIGDDGKPVGEGEIIDIYANTVHYVAKTDKKGYARLKINLNPKKYTFYAEYKSFKTNTNKIVVKQTLKLVKKTVKVKKGKKLVLKAKLKWSNGKAINGKKIVFKFKGKKYTAKTNNKGVAKVTIKKKVTKKLKKGKKYKYTATYKTNTVKGKVKVKK